MGILTESDSEETHMPITGGLTENIFPEVERWFDEHIDRQYALRYVAMHKGMNRYKSMIDFLFCETFFHFKDPCFRFYQGRGRSLDKCAGYSSAMRDLWERQLLIGLSHAYQIFRAKREITWNSFRLEFLELELMAA